MLDTVILTIPRGSYKLKPYMFTPNADILKGPGNYLVKCVSNPSAKDKKEGIYRPRLTLIKRMTKKRDEIPLKVEFSVPKMLFGNNVNEVEDNDFDAVVKALQLSMQFMGALVSIESLKNAVVSAFHPSKNIELVDGYTSGFVISELNKVNANKKMDLNKDSFRNNGHSLQFYTNSHSLVIYDKMQDLLKPEKRAIDKDRNTIQSSLFDRLFEKKNRKEILRIEVRLAKKVKLNAVFRSLGLKENPTFAEVFRKEVCQKIVMHYWKELVDSNSLFVFSIENNSKITLERIFKNNPKIKAKQAVYLVGLWALSKDGIRSMRAVVERRVDKRTWYRIAKDLPVLEDISDKVNHDWVKQVKNKLEEFSAFKISTL